MIFTGWKPVPPTGLAGAGFCLHYYTRVVGADQAGRPKAARGPVQREFPGSRAGAWEPGSNYLYNL